MSAPLGQNVDPENDENRTWGSSQWFTHLWQTQGGQDVAAYYGPSGYQLFRRRRLVDVLRAETGERSGALLEIGCGNGALAHLVAEAIPLRPVVASDFVWSMLGTVQGWYPDVQFLASKLPDLPHPDRSFDWVVASEVLYYLDGDQRRQALLEIDRVLRPGGMLLFSSTLGERYFTPESAVRYLSRRFRCLSISYLYNRLYHRMTRPLWAARNLDRLLRTGEQPGTPDSQRRFLRWKPWLANWPARTSIHLLARVGERVLASERLPDWCDRLSRVIQSRAKTNVVIVAGKLDGA